MGMPCSHLITVDEKNSFYSLFSSLTLGYSFLTRLVKWYVDMYVIFFSSCLKLSLRYWEFIESLEYKNVQIHALCWSYVLRELHLYLLLLNVIKSGNYLNICSSECFSLDLFIKIVSLQLGIRSGSLGISMRNKNRGHFLCRSLSWEVDVYLLAELSLETLYLPFQFNKLMLK